MERGTTVDSTSERMVSTPRGPLLVRPVEASDADGLIALYEGLDADDRYRRFFSGFRPDRRFVASEVARASTGGFELVAVTPDGQVVAAAGWVPLPDGDGELDITVDRAWRGWLGPFLFDALLDAASARGVRNLQAEVLLLNRPMLALARSRGFVTMSHPDRTVVRIALGAGDRMPSWPDRSGPRVLVETPGGHWHAEEAAEAAGLRVLVCSGPSSAGAGGRSGCPELAGRPCPLVADADVVVVCHPPDDPAWDAIRGAHRRLDPGTAVVVEPGARGRPADGEQVVVGADAEVASAVSRVAGAG